MFTSTLLSSCDWFFVRYISFLSHHVEKSFVRSGLHVLCTITFVPAQQDGSVRSKCHERAANASSSLLKIGEGHLHRRVSSSIHPSTYLRIHPLLTPPPSPPPTTMSQPLPQSPSTIAEHVVNTELCKKEQVCPSRTSSPPPLPRESSHHLTYPPSTPILLASMEHTRLPMELSVYAPTTVLAPAPLRKDQPRCVRGAYRPRHATSNASARCEHHIGSYRLGRDVWFKEGGCGVCFGICTSPSYPTPNPPIRPPPSVFLVFPPIFPLSSTYSRRDAALAHHTATLPRTVQLHIHPLLAYSSTRLESVWICMDFLLTILMVLLGLLEMLRPNRGSEGVAWEGCRVLFGGLSVGLCVRNRCIVQEREVGWYNIFRAR
jgi:hypothetical protein